MRQILTMATLVALSTVALAPVVSANTIVETILETVACRNPGYQGTITTVPYFVWVDGTGWVGSRYYVYGSTSYENVDRYNHCVAGVQVGAVWISYAGSSSWASCVNCVQFEANSLP